MEFSVNHPVLYLLAGILIAVVLAQSVFFLIKALRRSKEIGMDQAKIKKTIKTAALFTIAPAVSIVISVITLSKSLGIPLPWLRLSVVGSLSYEAIAASNAVSAMGLELGKISALTAQQYVNIALVMTLSIMVGIWLVPVIGKKLLRGMTVLENRDAKWADIFQNAHVYRHDLRISGLCVLRFLPPVDAGGLRRHLRACAGMRHGGIRCDHGGLRAAHEEIQVELGQRLRAAHFSGAGHGFRHSSHRMAGLRRCRYEKAA